jgi:hypothetical protein
VPYAGLRGFMERHGAEVRAERLRRGLPPDGELPDDEDATRRRPVFGRKRTSPRAVSGAQSLTPALLAFLLCSVV